MRKIIFFVISILAILTIFSPRASAVIKPLTPIFAAEGAEGLAIAGQNIVTYINRDKNILVSAHDIRGAIVWSKDLNSGGDDYAMVIKTALDGNLYVVGSSSLAIQNTAPISPPIVLNPDGIALETPQPSRAELTNIQIWKLSPSGELLETLSQAISQAALIVDVAISQSGFDLLLQTTSGPVIRSLTATAALIREIKIGSTKTVLSTVIRESDGYLNLFGSSTESLGGKKLVGLRDGVLIKLSNRGVVSKVVRSSISRGQRNWDSATQSLLLVGTSTVARKTETAVTKFTSGFIPSWTTRLPSGGYAVAVDGIAGNSFFAYENKSQSRISVVNRGGKITSSYSAPGRPISIGYSKNIGVVLLLDSKPISVYGFMPTS